MSRSWRHALLAGCVGVCASTSGCTFDAHGLGTDGTLDVGVDDETVDDANDSDDSTGTGEDDDTGTPTGSDSSDSEDGSGSDSGTDTDPCDTTYARLVWVADAQSSDMQLQPALGLPGQPQFAYSEQPGIGSVTFPLSLACSGTYHTWGLVWDRYPGNLDPNNADSFNAVFDALGVYRWEYGCGTGSLGEGVWSWQRLENFVSVCPQSAAAVELLAGEHTFTVTNIESGNAMEGNYAGIAAILVSTDPNHDPYVDYDPNG